MAIPRPGKMSIKKSAARNDQHKDKGHERNNHRLNPRKICLPDHTKQNHRINKIDCEISDMPLRDLHQPPGVKAKADHKIQR